VSLSLTDFIILHNRSYNPTNTVGALAYCANEGMIEYLERDRELLVEPKIIIIKY